jgi:hypothetical protein
MTRPAFTKVHWNTHSWDSWEGSSELQWHNGEEGGSIANAPPSRPPPSLRAAPRFFAYVSHYQPITAAPHVSIVTELATAGWGEQKHQLRVFFLDRMVVTQSALIDQNHFETNQLLFPEGLVHHFQWVESAMCLNVATTAVFVCALALVTPRKLV